MYAQLSAKEIDIALLNVERMRSDDVVDLTLKRNLLTVPAMLTTTSIIQGICVMLTLFGELCIRDIIVCVCVRVCMHV